MHSKPDAPARLRHHCFNLLAAEDSSSGRIISVLLATHFLESKKIPHLDIVKQQYELGSKNG